MNRLLSILILLFTVSCSTKENKQAVYPPSLQKEVTSESTTPKVRFQFPIDFDNYKVDNYIGQITSANLTSSRTARQFRSAIRSSVEKKGINFAGRYNLAMWGCGTSCQNGAVTDLKTGQIYDLPAATSGYEHRINSRLLVVNPPDSSGFYEGCGYCTPELWVWIDKQRKFKRLH